MANVHGDPQHPARAMGRFLRWAPLLALSLGPVSSVLVALIMASAERRRWFSASLYSAGLVSFWLFLPVAAQWEVGMLYHP